MSLRGFKLKKDGLHGDQVPTEILDWSFNWAKKWLVNGDTITTSLWSDDAGGIISHISDNNINGITSLVLDLIGAVAGEQFLVTNLISTSGGRTASRSFLLDVVAKKP